MLPTSTPSGKNIQVPAVQEHTKARPTGSML